MFGVDKRKREIAVSKRLHLVRGVWKPPWVCKHFNDSRYRMNLHLLVSTHFLSFPDFCTSETRASAHLFSSTLLYIFLIIRMFLFSINCFYNANIRFFFGTATERYFPAPVALGTATHLHPKKNNISRCNNSGDSHTIGVKTTDVLDSTSQRTGKNMDPDRV